MIRNLLKGAALGVVLTAATYGMASAAPVSFTWNPAGVGLNGASFTANNIVSSDFSTITLTPVSATSANFTDTGFLPITQFQLTPNVVSTPTLNASGGYGLYFQFTATGTQQASGGNPIPGPNQTFSGTINSLTFQLIGYTIPSGQNAAAFTFNAQNVVSASLPAGSTSKVLAQGALVPGTGTVTLAANALGQLNPSAQAQTTFQPCTGAVGACTSDESAFFVAPPLNIALDLFAAFTNTPSVILNPVTVGSSVNVGINGGGGNENFTPVPEPGSLGIFGIGLLALGMLFATRRARR